MKPTLLLFAGSITAFTQAQPGIQWQKSLGGSNYDEAYFLQQCTDGGYVLAGRTRSINGDVAGNQGQDDFWVVRLDTAGQMLWQKPLGGSVNDGAVAIRQTTDGGYVVAGWTFSNSGQVSGNHGNADAWVVKLDFSGVIEWQKSFGGSMEDAAYSVEQTSDGGYIIAGYALSANGTVVGNHGGSDAWVIKLDASGTLQWQKPFGGSLDDKAYSVQQTSDGGFIFAGYTNSNNGDVDGNHGDFDYWVVKMDASGNFEWQKTLGGLNEEYAYSIQQTTDGGYIVGGWSISNDGDVSGNHGNGDYWVVKLDSSSNILWQRALGGSMVDKAYTVRETADAGFVVAGSSNSTDGDDTGNHGSDDYWMAKLDAAGATVWEKSMGGTNSDIAWPMQPTSDGGYVVAGWSGSTNGDVSGNHGDRDIWVVKLASDVTEIGEQDGLGGLRLFPNPTPGRLTLQLDKPYGQFDIRVTDVTGRLVNTVPVGSGQTSTFDLGVGNGVYFVQVNASPGSTGAVRVVVDK